MKLGLSLKEECEARMKRDQEREKKRREHMRKRHSSSSSSSSRSSRSSRSSSSSRSSRSRRHRHRRSHSSGRKNRSRHRSRGSHSRSRERRSSRERPTGNVTNSRDPKLVASRVFIGNLPTSDLTKPEVDERFGKYGKILGMTLLNGYGFIQFDKVEDAMRACEAETGTVLKNHTLDVKMAAEGKRGGGDRSERSERSDRTDRDRSERSESSRPPPYGEKRALPPPPHLDPYGRGLPPPPPHLDPFIRGPLPPHLDPYIRPPFPMPPLDPYGRPRPRFPPGMDPYRPPFRDPYPEYPHPPVPYIPPVPVVPAVPLPLPPSIDCEIIVVDEKQRAYAEIVKKRLMSSGIVTEMNVLLPGMDTLSTIEMSTRLGRLFAVIVNEQNEIHRSITVNILHGAAQEHRNMPLDDACALVTRIYDKHVLERKERAAAAMVPVVAEVKNEFISPSQNTLYLLNLLADNRFLTMEELDEVIDYLVDRRDRLILSKGGLPASKRAKFEHERSSSPPRPVRKPSPDIDNRILGYLRNEKDLMSKLAPERLAAERLATERLVLERLAPERRPQENMAPDRMSQERIIPDRQALDRPPVSSGYSTGFNASEPPSSSFNTSINFDNPTVQKALDNLIMSGPSLLKSITENARKRAAAAAGGESSSAVGIVDPAYGKYDGQGYSNKDAVPVNSVGGNNQPSGDGWPMDYKPPPYGGN